MQIETFEQFAAQYPGVDQGLLQTMFDKMHAALAKARAEGVKVGENNAKANKADALENPVCTRTWCSPTLWPDDTVMGEAQQKAILSAKKAAGFGNMIKLEMPSSPQMIKLGQAVVDALAEHGHTPETVNMLSHLPIGGEKKGKGFVKGKDPVVKVPHGRQLFAYVLHQCIDPGKVERVVDSLFPTEAEVKTEAKASKKRSPKAKKTT